MARPLFTACELPALPLRWLADATPAKRGAETGCSNSTFRFSAFQVVRGSQAGLAASTLARLRKKIAISSRMTKALKAELVQKARQLRVTSVPTVWLK